MNILRFPRNQAVKSKPWVAVKNTSMVISTKPVFQNRGFGSIIKDFGLGKLNHVAIAVTDLKEATKLYKDVLGAKVSEAVPLKDHGVTTVFVDLGNTKLELLEPLGENSPIKNFLEKKPTGGIHHICIEVDDINLAVKDLQAKGVKVLNPVPTIGAHGKPVVFVHPKSVTGVLLELEQK